MIDPREMAEMFTHQVLSGIDDFNQEDFSLDNQISERISDINSKLTNRIGIMMDRLQQERDCTIETES